MQQDSGGFSWSNASQRAAELLARDEQTDEEIAADAKVTRTTLWRWKQHPDFAARIEEHRAEYRARVRRHGIAVVENRVNSVNTRWRRLQSVMDARAVDPEMQDVPGGNTGLLVRQAKLVKLYDAGEDEGDEADADGEVLTPMKTARVVYEYSVDTGLMAEMRALEKQAAQELGQWSEKHEHSGPGGGAIPLGLEKLSIESLQALGRIADEVAGVVPVGSPAGGQ